ncbi:MAG: hypothetical protein KGI82_06690, partial [Betaproteobacteria bacterium]|nr:hypothetical protein [Betaproteobacteria bacterium]
EWLGQLPRSAFEGMDAASRIRITNFLAIAAERMWAWPAQSIFDRKGGHRLHPACVLVDETADEFVESREGHATLKERLSEAFRRYRTVAPALHAALTPELRRQYAIRLAGVARLTAVTRENLAVPFDMECHQETVRIYTAFGKKLLERQFYRGQKCIAVRISLGKQEFVDHCLNEINSRVVKSSGKNPKTPQYFPNFGCREYKVSIRTRRGMHLLRLIEAIDKIAFWQWRLSTPPGDMSHLQRLIAPIGWLYRDAERPGSRGEASPP